MGSALGSWRKNSTDEVDGFTDPSKGVGAKIALQIEVDEGQPKEKAPYLGSSPIFFWHIPVPSIGCPWAINNSANLGHQGIRNLGFTSNRSPIPSTNSVVFELLDLPKNRTAPRGPATTAQHPIQKPSQPFWLRGPGMRGEGGVVQAPQYPGAGVISLAKGTWARHGDLQKSPSPIPLLRG